MNTLSLYVQRNREVISADSRSLISKRYCTVTSAMNREFWNITSDRQNSIYVGSYGRGTAIDTSDIDILMSLPESYYNQFNSVYGNGQSRLLQVVRQAILVRYPRSEVRADGQVVKINFSDGMFFEILPAFKNWDGSYRYPDTNMGGNWRSTNPKAEQDAMKNKNISSNGLLFDTCKHLRYVRDNYFRSYHLPDGRNGMRRCPDGTGSSGTAAVRGRRGMAQVRQRCGMPPGMAKGISANGE